MRKISPAWRQGKHALMLVLMQEILDTDDVQICELTLQALQDMLRDQMHDDDDDDATSTGVESLRVGSKCSIVLE